jgi:hypothetical protein
MGWYYKIILHYREICCEYGRYQHAAGPQLRPVLCWTYVISCQRELVNKIRE